MCTLMSKEHLFNAYSCTCTGAQNTCSKVHATLNAKKLHIYIYVFTYAYAYISTRIHMRIYDTAQTRWITATETQNLCTNMHTHTYTNVYTCMRIPIHIHMQLYTYMHFHTNTYIHTYTHTHTPCTYAQTQARLDNSAAATAWEARLDATKAPHFSSRSGSVSSLQRDLFDAKRRVSAKQSQLTAARHTITTARLQDNNLLSALVRSQSTQFMARPSCEPRSQCSEMSHFHHFLAFSCL